MSEVLSLKEIQECELNILKDVVALFDQNNIIYLLAYGTMLGTVRHKGFIPWDDDIDIFVPRDDYERLKKILQKSGTGVERLSYGIPGDKGYPYPYIKITDISTHVSDENILENFKLHVWIDIFPLDHVPNERSSALKIVDKTGILMRMLGLKITTTTNNGLKNVVKGFLGSLLGGYKGIAKIIDARAAVINRKYATSKAMGNIVWPQYKKDFFDSDMLFPVVSSAFCDAKFNIPKNYDKHLNYIYGDYMQLPPEDKRQRHFIKAYRNGD